MPCFVVSGLHWYRVEIGFALVCVGIKFVLCCCVGSGCAVFCGAVGFFFFFLLWTGGGGGCGCGCGWCCGCFFCSGIYYFIVVVILFYYDIYIILLC